MEACIEYWYKVSWLWEKKVKLLTKHKRTLRCHPYSTINDTDFKIKF